MYVRGRDLLDRPDLQRGPSAEEVQKQIKALDGQIKKLSREGSALRAALDAAPSPKVKSPARKKEWAALPMSKIMAMQGMVANAKKEETHEEYHSVGVGVPKASAAFAGKSMKQIAEEAQAAERQRISDERKRLAAPKSSLDKKASASKPKANDFLSRCDDRYEEDAHVDEAKLEVANFAREVSNRRAAHHEVPVEGFDDRKTTIQMALERADKARSDKKAAARRGSVMQDLVHVAKNDASAKKAAPRRAAAVHAQLAGALKQATRMQSGPDWSNRVLPMLESVIDMLSGGGLSSHSLAQMNPCEAFLSLHKLVMRRDDDPPLARGECENVQQAALRVQAQADTSAIILPKSRDETDDDFKLRLSIFKPRTVRGKAGKKPSLATLVLPRAADEKAKDFEERMKVEAAAPFVVLPRDPHETLKDYQSRLDETKEARTLWMSDEYDVPPPLLMPRGKHESAALCQQRFAAASSPPSRASDAYCPVWLPQGEGEDSDMFEARLEAQAKARRSIPPFDAKLEDEEEFEMRMASEIRASRNSR